MIPFVGGFETTYLPMHDVDVAELTRHTVRFAADTALLRRNAVRIIRYPVRWHRVEPVPGVFDWTRTDRELAHLRALGFEIIVDLVHHTSYPKWLADGFADPRFPAVYLRYVRTFALRFPWIDGYMLFNEPFSTTYLCGHEGVWPPYLRGVPGLVALLRNVLPALSAAARLYRDLLPGARHVYNDSCERHTTGDGDTGAHRYTDMANDRRFFVLDVLLGRDVDAERPFAAEVLRHGGGELTELAPIEVDVLGLDYYAHSQWQFLAGRGVSPSPEPPPMHAVVTEYWDRYQIPCMVSETNIRGYPSDRATWLKYTVEQCEIAAADGVPMVGYCWFPVTDSCDWDSMLFRPDRRIDPVGVFWLDDDLSPRTSSMSDSFALAAAGAPAAALPAFQFREPVSRWLRGYLPQMRHWTWHAAPVGETGRNPPEPDGFTQLRTDDLLRSRTTDGIS